MVKEWQWLKMGNKMRIHYKQIIKSKSLRLKILKCLSFIPDKPMVRMQYRIATGNRLNLKNPQTFNEKIQWYKLFYRNPLMTKCADKYAVREYVASKGLSNILNECYGVYDSFEQIDFESLPSQFVLKVTSGSGTNLFCKDKSTFDKKQAKKVINMWMKPMKKTFGREWCYENIKPRIICENYLTVNEDLGEDLSDYKFFCFDGRPVLIQVDINRMTNHKRNLYRTNWEFIDETITYESAGDILQKPKNLEKMIITAAILSEGFPHARIDLYNYNNKVIFGEITFYHGCGYERFSSHNLEMALGQFFTTIKTNVNQQEKRRSGKC